MIDLGFTHQKYTWTNKHKNNKTLIMERLDRFLRNQEWINLYPDSNVHHLPRTHSDHCLLLLKIIKCYAKPNKIFRLETMWMRHLDFPNIVKISWNHSLDYNTDVENFINTTNNWNKETFGNIFKQKNKILKRLKGLQQMDPNYHKDPFHYELENTLINDFNEVLIREEGFLKLKSRVQWLNKGDANTKCFHASTINKSHRNGILGLNDLVEIGLLIL